MKKILSILLISAILLSACSGPQVIDIESDIMLEEDIPKFSLKEDIIINKEESQSIPILEFNDLSDPELLRYISDITYSSLLHEVAGEDAFIENIEAKYISKEYLEELEYNSKSNFIFGYSLSDLEEIFDDHKFIFTSDSNGNTIIEEMSGYDDTYEKVMKNVLVGGGVILVNVSISYATAGVAPAASLVFAVSAKTGTVAAMSSGLIIGLVTAYLEGVKTGDFSQVGKTTALYASQGFKWSAIGGALLGGTTGTIKAIGLKGATLNGLTFEEASLIQKESGYPLDVIKQLQNMEQYEILKEAGLKSEMVGNKIALIKNIDLNQVDKITGKTNLERILSGNSPLDPDGIPFELHHIGQKNDGTLAMLTKAEHMMNGNNTIWHDLSKSSEIDRQAFIKIRNEFWKNYLMLVEGM